MGTQQMLALNDNDIKIIYLQTWVAELLWWLSGKEPICQSKETQEMWIQFLGP